MGSNCCGHFRLNYDCYGQRETAIDKAVAGSVLWVAIQRKAMNTRNLSLVTMVSRFGHGVLYEEFINFLRINDFLFVNPSFQMDTNE